MPGRKPIFASLITDTIDFLRDNLFRATLEPQSPAKRRAKRMKKKREENKR